VERIHKQARPPEADAGRVADDYDRIADEYAKRIYDELDGKPFDRELQGGAAGRRLRDRADRLSSALRGRRGRDEPALRDSGRTTGDGG
jgi:hypothetical protein